MNTVQTNRTNEPAEAVIETLLAPDEPESIVDGLFALSGDDAPQAGPDQWSRAVHRRLQARLAARMRATIATGDDTADMA